MIIKDIIDKLQKKICDKFKKHISKDTIKITHTIDKSFSIVKGGYYKCIKSFGTASTPTFTCGRIYESYEDFTLRDDYNVTVNIDDYTIQNFKPVN